MRAWGVRAWGGGGKGGVRDGQRGRGPGSCSCCARRGPRVALCFFLSCVFFYRAFFYRGRAAAVLGGGPGLLFGQLLPTAAAAQPACAQRIRLFIPKCWPTHRVPKHPCAPAPPQVGEDGAYARALARTAAPPGAAALEQGASRATHARCKHGCRVRAQHQPTPGSATIHATALTTATYVTPGRRARAQAWRCG